jgi:Leucine-rich repeat (LRR) protein
MKIKRIRELNTFEYVEVDNYNSVLDVILNDNKINKIPKIIFELNNLENLCLDQNLITEIPNSIGKLINLKFLSLHNNLITDIPDSIGNLTKLEKIHLGYNKIKYLPKTFANLILCEISLDNNKLCGLPIELANKHIKLLLSESSYENIDNLDENCNLLIIDYLKSPLLNLPMNLQVLKLYNPIIDLNKIKIPFGCRLYVNGLYVS